MLYLSSDIKFDNPTADHRLDNGNYHANKLFITLIPTIKSLPIMLFILILIILLMIKLATIRLEICSGTMLITNARILR